MPPTLDHAHFLHSDINLQNSRPLYGVQGKTQQTIFTNTFKRFFEDERTFTKVLGDATNNLVYYFFFFNLNVKTDGERGNKKEFFAGLTNILYYSGIQGLESN